MTWLEVWGLATDINSPYIPEDTNAEKSILGAVLLDNRLLPEAAVLPVKAFAMPFHQHVFNGMLELGKQEAPIDPVTLSGVMSEEDYDGARVAALIDTMPRLDNLGRYVEQVQRKYIIREAMRVASRAMLTLQDPEASVAEIQQIISKLTVIADAGSDSSGVIQIADYAPMWTMELEEKRNGTSQVKIPLGFAKLDRALGGGGRRGKLITIGARTGQGKSAFMFTIATNMSRAGYKVHVQEMEMSKDELVDRHVAATIRVDGRKIGSGVLTDQETKDAYMAAMELATWPLTINDSHARTPEDLKAEIRQLARTQGLDCVLIDYLLLPRYRTKDFRVEVGLFLKELRALAKELDILIIALAQLNRGADGLKEDQRPKLSDFKETGNIEEDSDVCLFPYRPSYFPGMIQQAVETDAEVIIAKQRQGPTGTINMEFHPAYTLYRER